MSEAFDPYLKWLGIKPKDQPPHHYRLLGLDLFEDDPDLIENAADQKMGHIRTFATGKYAKLSQKLLNEISTAKVSLLNTEKKAAYDADLKSQLGLSAKPVAKAAAPKAKSAEQGTTTERAMATETFDFKSSKSPQAATPVKSKAKPTWQHPGVIGAVAGGLLLVVILIAVVASRNESSPSTTDLGDSDPAEREIVAKLDAESADDPQPDEIEPKTDDPKEQTTDDHTTDVIDPPVKPPLEEVETGKNDVYLDDLQETDFRVGFGDLGKHGSTGFPADHPIQSVVFRGAKATHALSVCPPGRSDSFVAYELGGKYKFFTAMAGIIDAERPERPAPASPVVFKVFGDGKQLWLSKPFARFSEGQDCQIDVTGVRELSLVATCTGSQSNCHAVWINPRVSTAAASAEESTDPYAERNAIYLDDLQEKKVQVHSGIPLGKHGKWSRAGQAGGRIVIDGQTPEHSLVLHPISASFSSVTYDVPKNTGSFLATTAVLNFGDPRSPLVFKVLGDGKELWKSQPIQSHKSSDVCRVSVANVRELTLRVDCAGTSWGAWATWVNPHFLAAKDHNTEEATAKKLAVPNAAAQQQAKDVIRELFKDEIEAARTADQKLALAEALLEQAAETDDDATARYALYQLSGSFALAAGDARVSLAVIEALDQEYDVDAWNMRNSVLPKIFETAKGKDFKAKIKQLAVAASGLAEDAVAEDEYETALQMSAVALEAARKARDVKAMKAAASRQGEIELIAEEFTTAKGALDELQKNPTDANASLIAGRFFCFSKGDWDRGLPLLAKGADAELQTLAKADIAAPSAPAEHVSLGDKWWDLAKQEHAQHQDQINLRAAFWYERALRKLTDSLTRLRLERRLKTIGYEIQENFALHFVGGDDVKIPAPADFSLGDTFTVEALVSPDAGTLQHARTIVALNLEKNETHLSWQKKEDGKTLASATHISGRRANDPVTYCRWFLDDAALAKRNFHHLALVWDQNRSRKLEVYFDGKLISTGYGKYNLPKNARPATNMIYLAKFHAPFSGRLDEVRISKVARYSESKLPAEVDRFKSDSDTLALYHFDEGEGKTLHDVSGNGLHGTISGARWVKVLPGDAQGQEITRPTLPKTAAGPIWIEGEQATVKQVVYNNWYDNVQKNKLSGGAWAAHFHGEKPGFLAYEFRAAQAGDYRFWLRANHVSNVLTYRVNNRPWQPVDFSGRQGAINIAADNKLDLRFVSWNRIRDVSLQRGLNRIEFRLATTAARKPPQDHGAIDCFCFTTDANWSPSGVTKPQSVKR